jgi:hypothetical protein
MLRHRSAHRRPRPARVRAGAARVLSDPTYRTNVKVLRVELGALQPMARIKARSARRLPPWSGESDQVSERHLIMIEEAAVHQGIRPITLADPPRASPVSTPLSGIALIILRSRVQAPPAPQRSSDQIFCDCMQVR